MSQHEYDELWHYSERFTKDKLQRSELVTMAWKASLKMGERRSLKLMQSVMHFRSKQLKLRSAFPGHEMGKSIMDVWNRNPKISIDTPIGQGTLAEYMLPVKTTPLDFTIANDFMNALDHDERVFLDDLTAGYSMRKIAERNNIGKTRLAMLRQSVQEKAVAYLR